MRVHDAVVIGAGPAGLSAAAALSREWDCLLLEQGKRHTARHRSAPDELLAGVGGAGLFSDGKHSFYPAASELWTLPEPHLLAAAYADMAALLERHGVVAGPWQGCTPGAAPTGVWHIKRYPSVYMPLARRMDAIAELEGACPSRWTGARVLAARRAGRRIALEVARDGSTGWVHTRALVVATGRLSPRWVRPWLTTLGARFEFRRLEFGVRVESGASSPLFTQLRGVDPKLRFVDADEHGELRTFCCCREGEVVCGEADGITAYSGRADGPPTGRSNLGLLVRTRDAEVAREVEAVMFAARPIRRVLATIDGAGLQPVFGERGAALMVRGLARLREWCPGLRDDSDAWVYAPCIEGVGDYPVDDGALRVAPGVWVAGDVCGRFRGIVASMVSGRYVALQLLRGRA